MASINESSILEKLNKFLKTPDIEKQTKKILDDIMLGKIKLNISNIGNGHTPEEAASQFICTLYHEMETCGLSQNLLDALERYDYTSPGLRSDGTYDIYVYYHGDPSRDSLYKKGYPNGIDNLAVLYNEGVDHIMNPVYGLWHGKQTKSRTEIPAYGFLDQAIIDFYGNHASEYGVIEIRRVDDNGN